MSYTVTFPPPAKPMSLNDRQHWSRRRVLTKAWRTAAHWHALDAVNRKQLTRGLPRSLVEISLPVKSLSKRRDPSNLAPTLKAVVDGLVDAGVWPDDDSSRVVTAEPQVHVGDHLVHLTITPITSLPDTPITSLPERSQ